MSTNEVKTQLEKQRDYVKSERIQRMLDYSTRRTKGNSSLFDPQLSVLTMRSVSYRSEAHALADIVDNSIEAGATQVHVICREEKGKIVEIAILDDGSGMPADFLPWAVSWGGSSQHGDLEKGSRNVFGRFGFGLPTASINRGTAFDVISRTDADFSMVSLDTKNLPHEDGVPTSPRVLPGKIPSWVADYVDDSKSNFVGGLDALRTGVVWRNLDRLTTRTAEGFESLVLGHFGVTYCGWLNQVALYVNGRAVEPIDLLFTTPSCRYFDVDGTRAEDHGRIDVPIKAADGSSHTVTIRLARIGLPAWTAAVRTGRAGRPPAPRMQHRKEYNGILMTRHDRFIQIWTPRVKGIYWNNYGRQVAVHLDFPPELDEVFGITPDKQTITPYDSVIDALENRGVFRAMRDLYKQVDREHRLAKLAEAEALDAAGSRLSEQVMERGDAIMSKTIKTSQAVEQRREEARKNLERKIQEISASQNLDKTIVRETLEKETAGKRFHVELIRLGESGEIYRCEQRGLQTVLQINTDHNFFRLVYSKIPIEGIEVRAGIELLLFTLATRELDVEGAKKAFYTNERLEWSRILSTLIDVQHSVIEDGALRDVIGRSSEPDEMD